jgi:hypothetical protein
MYYCCLPQHVTDSWFGITVVLRNALMAPSIFEIKVFGLFLFFEKQHIAQND